MAVPVKQKKIITPADCPFGTGDGVCESARRDAAKPLSCLDFKAAEQDDKLKFALQI